MGREDKTLNKLPLLSIIDTPRRDFHFACIGCPAKIVKFPSDIGKNTMKQGNLNNLSLLKSVYTCVIQTLICHSLTNCSYEPINRFYWIEIWKTMKKKTDPKKNLLPAPKYLHSSFSPHTPHKGLCYVHTLEYHCHGL